jgi:alanyl-tRNA synthetase
LAGDLVFKLHDTFGFPYDLTADVCREAAVKLDDSGFCDSYGTAKISWQLST